MSLLKDKIFSISSSEEISAPESYYPTLYHPVLRVHNLVQLVGVVLPDIIYVLSL